MGANNTHNYNSNQINYQDVLEGYNVQNQEKISFNPPVSAGILRNPDIKHNFEINSQYLRLLSKQEIIDEIFSQQFDPLFTTFRPQSKKNYGKSRILCSNITNQKIQQYKVSFRNQEDFKTYIISYFWRKMNGQSTDWPLAKTTNFRVYDQSKKQLEGGIAGFFNKNCSPVKQIYCKVYVQDIPLRLCHIKDIPFPQNLYVLKESLKGFQIIYQNIGYIKPFQDLICITRRGGIRVWINSDLSKNYPNIENIDENSTCSKSQSKLINQVLHLINSNADPEGQPISFTAYLKQRHVNLQHIQFQKIFQMVSRYTIEYQIDVPEIFNSIVQVLNRQEQQYGACKTQKELQNQENQLNRRPIISRNNSACVLPTDILNITSRRKDKPINNQVPTDKPSKRKSKAQSLKANVNQRNSVQSSLVGVSSHNLISQSLPIQKNFKFQGSCEQIQKYFKNYSNEDFSRSKQQQGKQMIKQSVSQSSQVEKLNQISPMLKIEKIQSTDYTYYHNEDKFSAEIAYFRTNLKKDAKNKIHQHLSEPNDNLVAFIARYPPKYNFPNTDKGLRQKRHLTYNPFSQNGQQTGFISSKDVKQVQEIRSKRNKETKQKLCSQKTGRLQDQAFIQNKEEVNATKEQLEQMRIIDRYLSEQIIQQAYQTQKKAYQTQKNKLPSDNHQNLLQNKTFSDDHHGQTNQWQLHNSPNNPAFTNSLSSKKAQNSPFYKEHEELSYPNQKHDGNYDGYSVVQQNGLINIESLSRQMVTSSSKVRNSQEMEVQDGQNRYYNDSLDQNQPKLKQPSYKLPYKQQNQSNLNEPIIFDKQNLSINLQKPSEVSSQNGVSMGLENLPEISRKQIKVPSFHSQLCEQYSPPKIQDGGITSILRIQQRNSSVPQTAGNQLNLPPAFKSSIDRLKVINSSTSIAQYVQVSTTPIHPKIVGHSPKVTFAMKSPQKIQCQNIHSSSRNVLTNVNIIQPVIAYGRPTISYNQIVNFIQPNVQRLSSKANTTVSHYAYTHRSLRQGTSSCKHIQGSSSKSMAPSIVQFSYLRHQQMLFNQHRSLIPQSNVITHPNQIHYPNQIPHQNQIHHPNFIPQQSENKSSNTMYVPFTQSQAHAQMPMYFFPSNPQNLNSLHLISHQPSLISNPMTGILIIPQESPGQPYNISRDATIYDQKYKKQNQGKLQTRGFSSSPQKSHRREASGVNIIPSDNEYRSYCPQGEIGQGNPPKAQNIHIPEMNQNVVNKVQNFSINVKPSIYPKNQSDHLQFTPGHSQYQPNSQSYIGNQCEKQDARSNEDELCHKKNTQRSYRFIQPIEESHTKSQYQDGISAYKQEENFIKNQVQSSIIGNINHLNTNSIKTGHRALSRVVNPSLGTRQPRTYSDCCQAYPQGYGQPSEWQKPSPDKSPLNPMTGRTIFINNQNQLNSQFVDQQSQQQSQVDYTYNSYDKWKDVSKAGFVGKGNKRSNNSEEYSNDDERFGHRYNVGQRHANHKKLVRSSIQGLNNTFTNNLSNNFNTHQKIDDQPRNWVSYNDVQQLGTAQNTLLSKVFFRVAKQYKQEDMDEEILRDLSML